MKSRLLALATLIFIVVFCGFSLEGCKDDNDDKDSKADQGNNHGWIFTGCNWKKPAADSGETGKLSVWPMSKGVQECIPGEFPDEDGIDFETLLTETLEGLMGEYETETSTEVVFQCNPHGSWVLPADVSGTFCDTYFSVPVTIFFSENGKEWRGHIRVEYSTYQAKPLWQNGAALYYSDENNNWELGLIYGQGGIVPPDDDDSTEKTESDVVWESTYPDESKRWVKK